MNIAIRITLKLLAMIGLGGAGVIAVAKTDFPPEEIKRDDGFIHVRPKYYDYHMPDFANVVICKGCARIYLEKDMCTVDPCPKCGTNAWSKDIACWLADRWELKPRKE